MRSINRDIIVKYLQDHPCVDCGIADIEVLEFDHIDPDCKVTEVSNLLTGSTERMLDEISKCDVRFANCHKKKTRRQMGWWHTSDR